MAILIGIWRYGYPDLSAVAAVFGMVGKGADGGHCPACTRFGVSNWSRRGKAPPRDSIYTLRSPIDTLRGAIAPCAERFTRCAERLHVARSNLHRARSDRHAAQPDLHLARIGLHAAQPDLHAARSDVHGVWRDCQEWSAGGVWVGAQSSTRSSMAFSVAHFGTPLGVFHRGVEILSSLLVPLSAKVFSPFTPCLLDSLMVGGGGYIPRASWKPDALALPQDTDGALTGGDARNYDA